MKAKKNAIKRMIAICLTAIMTLAPKQGSLTVKVNDKNTLEKQTIKLYKLFGLSVSGDNYAYTVNENYKSSIATALGLQETATSEELYNNLAGYTANSSELQKFADDFTTAALKAGTSETKASGKLNGVTEYKFTDLDYGYYLVYQTGTKEIQSSLVSVDAAEETIILKGEAPSIEKSANKETVEIGQVVTYTITGTIPDTTGYDTYVYKITDTLTAGLDFVEDAEGKKPEGTVYNVSVKMQDGEAENKTAQLTGDQNRTMTLDLSEWIRSKRTEAGKTFTVTYYAKVNKDAVVETNNSASLEYGNDQNSTTETTPDVVTTPTYPLDINKTIKGKTDTMLAGATFRLYRTENAAKNTPNEAIKVNKIVEGSYTVAENQNTESNMDMVTVSSAVGKGYNLHLNGLAAGDYWLVETEAPDGYNKLTAPVKITITKSGDTNVENWTISKGDAQETDKIIDIENSTGTILPETGGMGTILFTVVAVVLILGVVISFIRSRRKEA